MFTRTRGYLPHIESPHSTYFITFRLYDSLPQSVLLQYREELEHALKFDLQNRLKFFDEYEWKIESYLDRGVGHCWLREPAIAGFIADAFRKHDGLWYGLHAYTIMPNHIHVLVSLKGMQPLSEIVRNWKGSSSFFANKLLHRTGVFWQREYFDRLIKSERQFDYTVRYIYRNPVKAGLCGEVFQWPWSASSPEVQALLKRFFL